MQQLRLAVLVSGRGTNLQAILDAADAGALAAQVVVVLSDRFESLAFLRARQKGIPTIFLDPLRFPDRKAYDAALAEKIQHFSVDVVVLAGFMRILTPVFLRAFPWRIVNIHPALLPAFPGLGAQRRALEYGVCFSGCTVHFVDEGVDTGPVILQTVVPVYQGDTPEVLEKRILAKEHVTYPAALQLFAEGRLRLEGRRVFINWEGRVPRRPRDCVEEWWEEVKNWRKECPYLG